MSKWSLALLAILFTSLMLVTGCSKDDSNPAAPVIPDPIASFSFSGATVTPAAITFQNSSQNADAYYWDFDDGGSSVQQSPQHTYTQYRDYTVTLIARATQTGKADTTDHTITITPGKVFLDSVVVVDMPFTDQSGAGWDLTSGPDLIIDFVDSSANVLLEWAPSAWTDLTPSDLPVRGYTAPAFRITDWGMFYFVILWDYDDLSDNDRIGYPDGFSINSVIAGLGYVRNFTVQGWYNNSITVRYAIHWE